MAEISIHLFSKPEVEIDLEKAKPEDFKKLGEELKERLSRVAEIVEKLEKAGWERSVGMYDLNFYKKIKLSEVKQELEKLSIKADEVDIMEEEFDGEFEEDLDEEEN